MNQVPYLVNQYILLIEYNIKNFRQSIYLCRPILHVFTFFSCYRRMGLRFPCPLRSPEKQEIQKRKILRTSCLRLHLLHRLHHHHHEAETQSHHHQDPVTSPAPYLKVELNHDKQFRTCFGSLYLPYMKLTCFIMFSYE